MKDDRDGQTYKTVKIGSQWWMAENLNYAYLQPTASEDSSSFCYNNLPENCEKYGRLYLWSAMIRRLKVAAKELSARCRRQFVASALKVGMCRIRRNG